MAKRATEFERKLARIDALKEQADAGAQAELATLLAEDEAYVAGAAAAALGELGESGAAGPLAEALVRRVRGEQPDGGCMASEPAAKAMLRLAADEPDAYRAGLSYVRRERSGTQMVDRAVVVRIACATGLIQCGPPGALLDVVPLLADEEAPVRSGAARAIAALRSEAAAAVLHVKWLARDSDPEVLGACLDGLLACDAERYLPVAEAALDGGELGDLAALAIGESRAPGALAVLCRALDGDPYSAQANALALGLALLRSDEALEALFGYVASRSERAAVAAVEALGVHRHSDTVVARVRGLAAGQTAKVRAAVTRIFHDEVAD